MEGEKKLTTQEKAPPESIKQRHLWFICEVGAARKLQPIFFKVGGAVERLPKQVSLRHEFSDAIYGRCERYVSEDRTHANARS